MWARGRPRSEATKLKSAAAAGVKRRMRIARSRKMVPISVDSMRLRRSALVRFSSSMVFWCSWLMVVSSSLIDWISSRLVSSSSEAAFCSSLMECSSSLAACSSPTVRSRAALVASSCSRVRPSSSSRRATASRRGGSPPARIRPAVRGASSAKTTRANWPRPLLRQGAHPQAQGRPARLRGRHPARGRDALLERLVQGGAQPHAQVAARQVDQVVAGLAPPRCRKRPAPGDRCTTSSRSSTTRLGAAYASSMRRCREP